jgi:integrase
MPLTDAKIRTAKGSKRSVRLFDGGGLYLEVSPSGSKHWRLKYRYHGREKRISFGAYPSVPLAGRQDAATGVWIPGARERRDQARQLLAAGIDPSAHREALKLARTERQQNSFEVVAREWFAGRSAKWVPSHASRILARLERDIFPYVGESPIADLSAPALLEAIRRIEARGKLETAHRALGDCGQIMRYAIATGRATRDPSADLRGALPPAKGKHLAAITDPKRAGDLLIALDGYKGTLTVRSALRLAPLLWVRPGELRHARWSDFNLDAAEWRFKLSKTRAEHIVPLSSQAVAILRELYPVTGTGEYVFPGGRSAKRPMSDNAVLAALRSMGISRDEMSGHGVRAMARTIGDEELCIRPDFIEHQLGHAVRDPLGRAYNRTAFLPERKIMMQQWADYLDSLRADAAARTKPIAGEAAAE